MICYFFKHNGGNLVYFHDDVIKWKHFPPNWPLCGEFTGPGEFPTQRPVTRSFDVFFDLRLNKRLNKQPWGWWFETLSWSLWRHCNVDGKIPKLIHADSDLNAWSPGVFQFWFSSGGGVGVARDRPMTNGVLHNRPVMWSFAVSLSPAWTNCRPNRRVADFSRHYVHNHINRVYLTISSSGMSICRYCWAEARHGSTSSQGRSVFQRNCNKWTRKT